MSILALALLVAAIALAWVGAVRDEHLIVLRWPGRRRILLAHLGVGRYRLISPLGVPFALARYATARTEQSLASLRARTAARRPSSRSVTTASV